VPTLGFLQPGAGIIITLLRWTEPSELGEMTTLALVTKVGYIYLGRGWHVEVKTPGRGRVAPEQGQW